jgi:lysine-specific histone demethylase 1
MAGVPVSEGGPVQFQPQLPEWKTDAIEALGFGLLDKVLLVFETDFWTGCSTAAGSAGAAAAGVGRPWFISHVSAERGEFYNFVDLTPLSPGGRTPMLCALVAASFGGA